MRCGLRVGWLVLLLSAACARSPAGPDADRLDLVAVEVASGLASPVLVIGSAAGRLYVVEQSGRILTLENGVTVETPFLDITELVGFGGERGLLGMALHPAFEANGLFFVSYTDVAGSSRIDRYTAAADRRHALPGTRRQLLHVEQPATNHNGGHIAFAPDGMLWIGLGDGGGGGDPFGNGQNAGTLLGSMLRIDVDAGEPYAIPAGNPFASGAQGRPEIWAIGLRNPWRFAFDAQNRVYIADVGQNRREEVNVQPATSPGLNYGWNHMEGSACFAPPAGCDTAGLVLPAVEYATGAEGCAVTGGYVYRGEAMPALRGHYFYGDFCGGWVRSFRFENGQATEQRTWALGTLGNITSFGEDAAGELYITVQQGRVYRLEAR